MILATTLQFDPVSTGILFFGGLTVFLIVASLVGLKWVLSEIESGEGQALYGVIAALLIVAVTIITAIQSPGCSAGGVYQLIRARDYATAKEAQTLADVQLLYAQNQLLSSQIYVMELQGCDASEAAKYGPLVPD